MTSIRIIIRLRLGGVSDLSPDSIGIIPLCRVCGVVTRVMAIVGGLMGLWLPSVAADAPLNAAKLSDWNAGAGFRWRPLHERTSAVNLDGGARSVGFTRMPAHTAGIHFTNQVSDTRSITNRNLLSGSGVACGDVDGDGRVDLYFCGLDSGNRLYRNLGGWKFEDITQSSGVACDGQDSTGAAFVDLDGDGLPELIVNALGGGTRLFMNEGNGHFTEVTDAAGLRSVTGATSIALTDVDGDGHLDMYVCNFRPTTILDRPTTRFGMQMEGGHTRVATVNGRPVTEADLKDRFVVSSGGEVLEHGEADVLWLNNGRGGFERVSWTDGAFLDESGRAFDKAPGDWGLAARFGDLNGDGRPDLYVCNDLWTPDRIWLNESEPGRVRFRAMDTRALRNNATFSMGVDFGDFDRDGVVDFFAVDMLSRVRGYRMTQLSAMAPDFRPPGAYEDRVQMRRNTLHRGRGDGTFAEIAHYAGVEASEWSWGPILLDVDLDGYEDILVPNGQLRDFQDADGAERIEQAQRQGRALTQSQIQELVRTFPELRTPNVAFRNRHDLTFEEVGVAWGFADPDISQGMALADLDNDGDLDVITNNLKDAPGIYRNDVARPRVAVDLRGPKGNRSGIGARIQVIPDKGSAAGQYAGVPAQEVEVLGGSRYLSGDQPRRTFAMGDAKTATIEVYWPDGRRSRIEGAGVDRLYEIEWTAEGRIVTEASDSNEKPKAFVEVSSLLGHWHVDEPFDDFARQPLLPNRLSQLGPGVAWTDLDGDGWEDLVMSSGKGGVPGVYRNVDGTRFVPFEGTGFLRPTGRDLTTILPFGSTLLMGSANYEDGLSQGGYIRIVDLNRKVSGEMLLGVRSSVGPMAMADVTGNGELEIFIGGRVVSGRYPEPADSFLVKSSGGRLTVHQEFLGLGLVSGACFSDLTGDGVPELVVACEWGPVRIMKMNGDRMEAWDPVVRGEGIEGRLSQLTGWWTSVAAGDFDGDGRMDLVAGNWGLNSPHRASLKTPLRVYFGELFGTGQVDIIESYVDPLSLREVPLREWPMLRQVAPDVAARFESNEAYSHAGIEDVLGDAFSSMRRLEAVELASMVFLNRGEYFEVRRLPAEAQWSPVFGLCVGDADGDGNEDIFLAQNWAAQHPFAQRLDAGRGLWLRGDGAGGFSPWTDSGIAVYGDQRGAALADFDRDGRVDLVVTQNGSGTTLWKNVGGRPGIRIRLSGSTGNPVAYGASVRLCREEWRGPWRDIPGGSGYWSVPGAVVVLGRPELPDAVEVRWPGDGGKVRRYPMSDEDRGALEVGISRDGGLRVLLR